MGARTLLLCGAAWSVLGWVQVSAFRQVRRSSDLVEYAVAEPDHQGGEGVELRKFKQESASSHARKGKSAKSYEAWAAWIMAKMEQQSVGRERNATSNATLGRMGAQKEGRYIESQEVPLGPAWRHASADLHQAWRAVRAKATLSSLPAGGLAMSVALAVALVAMLGLFAFRRWPESPEEMEPVVTEGDEVYLAQREKTRELVRGGTLRSLEAPTEDAPEDAPGGHSSKKERTVSFHIPLTLDDGERGRADSFCAIESETAGPTESEGERLWEKVKANVQRRRNNNMLEEPGGDYDIRRNTTQPYSTEQSLTGSQGINIAVSLPVNLDKYADNRMPAQVLSGGGHFRDTDSLMKGTRTELRKQLLKRHMRSEDGAVESSSSISRSQTVQPPRRDSFEAEEKEKKEEDDEGR